MTVETSTKSYSICFCRDFQDLPDVVKRVGLKGHKICILTDDNVLPIYAEKVKEALEDCSCEIYTYSFKAGEKSKNLDTISDFYKFFIENHFDRKTVIVGLGGGVTGDMAGFAAATYMRGVPFFQIPTTLLAQVDSSVGGKVGVDFMNSKNMVGAFYQPEFVYINTNSLKTLPVREFNAGMSEVIKYGIIVSEEFYKFLIKNKEKIKNMEYEVLEEIIHRCCNFKAQVVARDEKEGGLREILNYGHTVGHAVESIMDFKLLHGECVAIGMKAAMYISYKRGEITIQQMEEFENILKFFDLPVNVRGLNADMIFKQMFSDKKVKDNKISFVLTKKIGETYRTTDLTKNEIIDAINYIL